MKIILILCLIFFLAISNVSCDEADPNPHDFDGYQHKHSLDKELKHFQLSPSARGGAAQHHNQHYASYLSDGKHTHHVLPGGAASRYDPAVDGQQLMAIVLSRHGDRTPVYVFENSQSDWPEGSGQLTGLGMKQQHDLGALLRQRYVEERQLVEPYWRLDQIYARSTSRTRTLQSAYSFWTGFFPPGTGPNLPSGEGGGPALPINLQPVPVMSASRYNDTLLYAYKNCPKLKRLIKETKASEEWRRATEENAELFARLTEIFGEPIGLKQMTQIKTLLNAERIHGRPQLEGITPEMMVRINALGAWVIKRKFATHEMGKLAAGQLPDEIRNRMRNMIIDHYELKDQEKAATEISPKDVLSPHSILLKRTYSEASFVMFSAHDGTILALLAALQAEDPKVPHFSSFITFELFDPVSADEPPVVKLWYDDEPLSIPGCAHRCSFAEFSAAVDRSYEPDWLRTCDIEWLKPLHEQTVNELIQEEVEGLVGTIEGQQELIRELQEALDYKKYKKQEKEQKKAYNAAAPYPSEKKLKEQKKAREELLKAEKNTKDSELSNAASKKAKKAEKAEKKQQKELKKLLKSDKDSEDPLIDPALLKVLVKAVVEEISQN